MSKTQSSDILQHLKDGRRLTQKEAINEYGAYRLAAIVHSLRNQGHNIQSKRVDVPTRYTNLNGTTRMANIVEYKLEDDLNSIVDYAMKENMVDEFMGFLDSITKTHSK